MDRGYGLQLADKGELLFDNSNVCYNAAGIPEVDSRIALSIGIDLPEGEASYATPRSWSD